MPSLLLTPTIVLFFPFKSKRAVIFVQLILNNFGDNHFSPRDWPKTMESERRRERIKTHVSMRERVVLKIAKKWLYKYHFSIQKPPSTM